MSFFKKIFGSKEEPKQQKLNYTLHDLEIGFVLDYFMQTWEVKHEARYDWGNESKTIEFTLFDGKNRLYLEVGEEEEINVSEKIKLKSIEGEVKSHIVEQDTPPKQIVFKEKVFYFDAEELGHCYENDSDSPSELICWTFYDKNEDEFINLERWGEYDIEAYYGKPVKEFEFSNILPNA